MSKAVWSRRELAVNGGNANHGPVKVLSRAEIEAIYGDAAKREPKPTAISARLPRGRFGVFRCWDDGRRELVYTFETHALAEATAGRLRDEMTDAECGEGWNYLPGSKKEGFSSSK